MNGNSNPAAFPPPGKRGARLRKIGVAVLLMGMGVTGIVWWRGQARVANDPSAAIVADNAKMRTHQTQLLYGKMGLVMQDLSDDLQQPDTQAALVAAFSALVAFGCFHFARQADDADASR